MIKELTRQLRFHGIAHAVYTSANPFDTSVSNHRYWHRLINVPHLVCTQFAHLSRQTMSQAIRINRLPNDVSSSDFRPMTEEDIPSVTEILNTYLEPFDVHPIFTDELTKHLFLPRCNVVDSFVVGTPVTDFVSYFHIDIKCKNETIHAAYLFYYAVNTVPIGALIQDAMITAKKKDCDVFNCLDGVLRNGDFLKDLKFREGDGYLNYNLVGPDSPSPITTMGVVLQ
jgi:glycylpeptide N-tetradecanoyltransferase